MIEEESAQETANEDLVVEKDEWIYLFGSDDLRLLHQLGYSCAGMYLEERMAVDYHGFKLWELGDYGLHMPQTPSVKAAKEAMHWEGARIATGGRYGFSLIERELIVIYKYLGDYTIVRPAKRTPCMILVELYKLSLIAAVVLSGTQLFLSSPLTFCIAALLVAVVAVVVFLFHIL